MVVPWADACMGCAGEAFLACLCGSLLIVTKKVLPCLGEGCVMYVLAFAMLDGIMMLSMLTGLCCEALHSSTDVLCVLIACVRHYFV